MNQEVVSVISQYMNYQVFVNKEWNDGHRPLLCPPFGGENIHEEISQASLLVLVMRCSSMNHLVGTYSDRKYRPKGTVHHQPPMQIPLQSFIATPMNAQTLSIVIISKRRPNASSVSQVGA
jgi:hypothetical protein